MPSAPQKPEPTASGPWLAGEFVLLEHAPPPLDQAATAESHTMSDPARHARINLHWDFMLALPGREGLLTWRLSHCPLTAFEPIAATAIAEHRRLYLTYEGPLSGGRGAVTRIDRGNAKALSTGGGNWLVELSGDRLRGRYEIFAGTWRRA